MGGFDLSATNPNNTTGCARSTYSFVINAATADYIPHHNWFQYYASTANPNHSRPSSVDAIGYTYEPNSKTPDPANHEYDTYDFFAAVKAGNFPAVSYLKAPAFQDGHAGYSDPLDEQTFVTEVVNFLEQQPEWKDTAVIVTWDDSDGWYDHAFATPTSSSYDPSADQLYGPGSLRRQHPPRRIVWQAGRWSLWGWHPASVPGDFTVRQAQLRQSHSHLPGLGSPLYRRQLAGWGRLGGGSFDASTGSLMDMFDFRHPDDQPLFLYPQTGTPVHEQHHRY